MIFADHHELWVREENGGLLAGTYYDEEVRERRRIAPDAVVDVSALPSELAARGHHLAAELASVLPAFEASRVVETRGGLPTYTPDGHHLLGAVPSGGGFYAVGGDNEAGITHGPGLGRFVAEIVDGRASQDISAYCPDRRGTPIGGVTTETARLDDDP